jgi:tripartite-type tricarboxylate transporter receptor subunit TctC
LLGKTARRWLCGLLAACVACSAWAQESFPSKVIRIVVPYPPGGANDLLARAVAKRLGDGFGKGVIVENRPGAATNIANVSVAKSPADGYTILLADRPFVTNPFIYPELQYDPIRDFEPVTLLGSAPVVLTLSTKAPFQSVPALIAYAKAEPGKVTMGSSGSGTTTHIAGELFQLRTGTKFNHIPYKGMQPAVNDALGGQIDTIFSPIGSVAPFIASNRLRAVAISSPTRSAKMPDVPTFDELGIKDFRVSNWYGLLVPSGTPKPVIALLNKAVLSSMQAQEVRDWYDTSQVLPTPSTPEEFAGLLRAEAATWEPVVKALGIKPN